MGIKLFLGIMVPATIFLGLDSLYNIYYYRKIKRTHAKLVEETKNEKQSRIQAGSCCNNNRRTKISASELCTMDFDIWLEPNIDTIVLHGNQCV